MAAILRSNWRTRNPIFIWGRPGIGKSQLTAQVTEELDAAFIDLRASSLLPEEIRGLPMTVVQHGLAVVKWSPPDMLPRDLAYDTVTAIPYAEPRTIVFDNPLKIKPTLTVHAVGEGHHPVQSVLVASGLDRFTVGIRAVTGHDDSGRPVLGDWVAGDLHWTATGKARAVLALDEFNAADPSVLIAFYQLIQDRRVGEWIMPEQVMIVAMGNHETDYGTTSRMPLPLLNRIEHHEMVFNRPAWMGWAQTRGHIHPTVIGYHEKLENALYHELTPQVASELKAFNTPRTWELVSNILHTCEDLPAELLRTRIVGAIGYAEGMKFATYRDVIAQLPSADDILSGAVVRLTSEVDIATAYALMHNLLHSLRERSEAVRRAYIGKPDRVREASAERRAWIAEADRMFAFMMANLPAEICCVAIRVAFAGYALPLDHRQEQLRVFTERYSGQVQPGAAGRHAAP